MRTVAQAHVRTGAPITVHTHADDEPGLLAQDVLARGADRTKMVTGHAGGNAGLDYLRRLAGRGSLPGVDRVGLGVLLPSGQRAGTVAQLCRRGRAEQMVLSREAWCYIGWFPGPVCTQVASGWHCNHVTGDVLAALRERGVTGEQITTMLVDNPRRYCEVKA
jgi:phosphotriesterase-related protein